MPDIAALSRQVIMDQTPDGLRIQLVDQDGRPMFAPGSTEPDALHEKAAGRDRRHHRPPAQPHLHLRPHRCRHGRSAGRHNRIGSCLPRVRMRPAQSLRQPASSNDRIYEVAGKAGSEPLLPEDPNASANRRLSILLMKEAPPVPADHKL